MTQTRKLAAILAADVVGYSRLAGADEERTLARLRALRSDLIDPTIAVHHGRVVKRTGDGALIEFRSVVDAVRCAIEVQNGMVERNAGRAGRSPHRVPHRRQSRRRGRGGGRRSDGRRRQYRRAARGNREAGAICLSEDAYRQVKGRLDFAVTDLGPKELKNIAEPIRVYFAGSRPAAPSEAARQPQRPRNPPRRASPMVVSCRSPIGSAAGHDGAGAFRR